MNILTTGGNFFKMKVTKKQLVEIISEEIQQALGEVGRGIPVGGGEALTCAEAVTKVEERMPSSVAKHKKQKQKLADMSKR